MDLLEDQNLDDNNAIWLWRMQDKFRDMITDLIIQKNRFHLYCLCCHVITKFR